MADFNIRADAVDVEQIMQRIRARIREKRGVDYTEDEIRQLATVKLEKFLDPRTVRSDLLEHYRTGRSVVVLPPLTHEPPPGNFGFEADTIYVSSRSLSGRLIALARRILNPLLKLFFNPNPIISVLHLQSSLNSYYTQRIDRLYEQMDRVVQKLAPRDDLDALNYEVLNNLVVEMTRVGIESKNLKMRVESLSSRLDFDERRGRALESLVQSRVGITATAATPQAEARGPSVTTQETNGAGETPSQRAKRRRRRRRRGGGPGEPGDGLGRDTQTAQAPPRGAAEQAASDIDGGSDVDAAVDGDAAAPEERGAPSPASSDTQPPEASSPSFAAPAAPQQEPDAGVTEAEPDPDHDTSDR